MYIKKFSLLKALTAEEAEDAYSKRDKIINHFAIMVKKRLAEAQGQNFEEEKDAAKSKEGGSSSKVSSLFLLILYSLMIIQ